MKASAPISTAPTVYEVWRWRDFSNVSGEGLIAYLTAYPSGKVTLAWCASDVNSVGVYDSIDEVLKIHGHGGTTELVRIFPDWSDDPS